MTEFYRHAIAELEWQQELLRQQMVVRLIPGMEAEFDRQFLALHRIKGPV